MKKLILILTFLLVPMLASAAWTITPTLDFTDRAKSDDTMYIVKLVCVSDASGTDYDFLTEIPHIMNEIKGSYLYAMKVVPSGAAAPDAAWDIDIEDENNDHLLDTDSNSTSATTFHGGHDTLGFFPMIGASVSFVSGTLGNTKAATIYLYFAK